MPSALTLILFFVTVSSVTAQTFQYSRGWTNGKRDGHKSDDRDVASNLERILSPCQLNKLKYLLEGKRLSERLLAPCEYLEDEESQVPPKRYKGEHNADLFDSFQ